MHKAKAVLPALTLALLSLAAPARADTHEAVHQAFTTMEGWVDRFLDQSEAAIVEGGAVISMNRNTVSGGALGCAAGAALGAGSTVMLGIPTGGATIAAAPDAVAIGCAVGAIGGAALGYPLDHPWGP